ncbi:hypothetical protein GCM10009837_76340 [Streptomyces durmitorensis]|uniref:Uncharacterized protein n=1 Tax=Streptomyces durmitorensis TaxID=319947 RepID=A0ABY4PXR0_9ACTN|nr:hypothetical protein [Streptomyces durmitorensis]UQT57744.1 hypothetical protein M4V62_23065 [Streptomyces durmitorensis]
MIFFQLLSAAIGFGMEQLLTSRYGSLGVLALVLLGIGIRAQNKTCLSASAMIFLLLMAQA